MNELILPLLIALLLPFITAPLGCITIWRRMAYFSDSVAHAALFGVAISVLFSFSMSVGIIASALLLAYILGWMERETRLAPDAMLGVATYVLLALGLMVFELATLTADALHTEHAHHHHHGESNAAPPIDMHMILVGDIYNITQQDIALIFGLAVGVIAVLIKIWQPLMLVTLHPQLAQSEGVNILRIRQISMLLVALGVACAVQIVGVLLVTALLIIPASAARFISQTPIEMVRNAIIISMMALLAGIIIAFHAGITAGAVIVLMSFLLCCGCYMRAR